jgi:hypothetical protein
LGLVFLWSGETEGVLFSSSLSIFGVTRIVSPRLPRTGSGDWTGAGGVESAGGDDFGRWDSKGAVGACLVDARGLIAAGRDDSDRGLTSEGADETCRLVA